jgi:hypothetical protein
VSDAPLSALAEALADLVTSIDTCDDDVLDPDTAVKWLETTGYLLDRLSPADRRALSLLLRRAAARQPDGAWRDDLLRIPEEFGLDDDQHELFVYGRLRADDARFGISGDRAILDAWLAATAL